MNSTTAATPEQRERVRRALDGKLDPGELNPDERRLYDDEIERLIDWDEAEREKEVTSAWQAAASAAATEEARRAIQEAGRAAEALDDRTLYVYHRDTQRLGPRLGIEAATEETLRACLSWELERRERQRELKQSEEKHQRETWKWLFERWERIAIAAGGWIVALAVAYLAFIK